MNTQRVRFEDFVFHIPSEMLFEKDGNPERGECLFIHDLNEHCLISFESGMQCFDMILKEKADVCSEEYSTRQVKAMFCYPEMQTEKRRYMVYFHAEVLDSNGSIHILPGQMNVAAGNPWAAEPRKFLLELLQNVEINDMKSAC